MDCSINAPLKQGKVFSDWVWFSGTTALKEGQGVCYDYDYGTATAADARRGNRVELPSVTNSRYFAGVASRDYAAQPHGQMIEIYRPGSMCNILAMASLTLGSGIITCQAGGTYAGYFTRAGFEGEGSAVPAQTVDRSATAGVALAILQTGKASGLVEVVTPPAAGGATVFMVGGVSYIAAATLAADATATLADGAISGIRKKFYVEGAQTTNNVVLTVTHGTQRATTATTGVVLALASDTMDDIGDVLLVEWCDGSWQELYAAGGVLAAT